MLHQPTEPSAEAHARKHGLFDTGTLILSACWLPIVMRQATTARRRLGKKSNQLTWVYTCWWAGRYATWQGTAGAAGRLQM